MNLNPQIFREYDIRGIVGKDLTPETAELLGKGIGTYFRRKDKKEVALGMDCRLSSPSLAQSLMKGLISAGCEIIILDTIPTPLLYYSIYHKEYDSGVMITGSHNPPEYNGFKMMAGQETLYGKSIQEIKKIIQDEDFTASRESSVRKYNIIPEYRNEILNNIQLSKKLKVVVDAGNGTAGVIACPIFRDLGCDVVELYCNMDGHFPHHHPDPTVPEVLEDLIQKVKEEKADLGIAYDGDGDRIGVIDDMGNIIWGDRLMILFARDILPSHPAAKIISEVTASKLLYEEIEKQGGLPIMWKSGQSLIKKR